MRCPNCGAILNYIEENNTFVCEYCGYEEPAEEKVVEKVVYKEVPAKANYNLVISYQSLTDYHGIGFTISDAGITRYLKKDETMSFKLVPGPHRIRFRFGQTSKTITIVINENEDPVTIVYNGKQGEPFTVTQPYAGENFKELSNGQYPTQYTGLSVAAFILSLTIFGSIWGIILGFVDLKNCTEKGQGTNKLSLAAVIIGMLALLISFAWVVGRASA